MNLHPVIFVAGPYRSRWGWPGIVLNIWRARAAAKTLWRMGVYPLVPHLNSCLMDGVVNDYTFLAGDRELLRRCDAVLVLSGWRRSVGTMAEIAYADQLGLPVIFGVTAFMAWWRVVRRELLLDLAVDEPPGYPPGAERSA